MQIVYIVEEVNEEEGNQVVSVYGTAEGAEKSRAAWQVESNRNDWGLKYRVVARDVRE